MLRISTPDSFAKMPSAPKGTVYAEIYRAVAAIPFGQVATYGDIAEAVKSRCTARQVGFALRNSPAGLRLPWHRVLGAGGRIALPGESGAEQRFRLQGEGVPFAGRRVRLEACRCDFERALRGRNQHFPFDA